MKNIYFNCALIFAILFSVIACEKQEEIPVPAACISVDSTTIKAFNTLTFTNCSGEADFYVIYTGEEDSEYDLINDTTIVDKRGNYIYQTTNITISEGASLEYYYSMPGEYEVVLVATNASRWGGEVVRDIDRITITVY